VPPPFEQFRPVMGFLATMAGANAGGRGKSRLCYLLPEIVRLVVDNIYLVLDLLSCAYINST
jgi:hypothetical protein